MLGTNTINEYGSSQAFNYEKNEKWTYIEIPEENRQVSHILNDLEDEDKDIDGADEANKKKIEEK